MYYTQAIQYYEESLRITENIYGKDNSFSIGILSNLGLIYQNTGNLEKAEEYIKLTIKLEENMHGSDSEIYAISLGNLGSLYYEKGYYDIAEKTLEQCI